MQARPSSGPQPPQQQPQPQFQPPPQAQAPPSAASPPGQAVGQPPKKAPAAAGKKAGGQKQAATRSPAQPQKGVKRPFPGDATEGGPAPKHALTANQRSASQQGQVRPGAPLPQGAGPQAPTNQQMGPGANAGLAEAKKLAAMEEVQKRRVDQEQQEVSVPPESLAEYHRRLKVLASIVGRVFKAIPKWYEVHGDDERAVAFFHAVSDPLEYAGVARVADLQIEAQDFSPIRGQYHEEL